MIKTFSLSVLCLFASLAFAKLTYNHLIKPRFVKVLEVTSCIRSVCTVSQHSDVDEYLLFKSGDKSVLRIKTPYSMTDITADSISVRKLK